MKLLAHVVFVPRAFMTLMICGALIALLSACKSEKSPAEATETPQSPAAQADADVVSLTPQLEQMVHIAPVGKTTFRDTLRIPGSIEVNEHREAKIGASVTGRISEIHVFMGDQVKQGQVLAQINSTELAQQQLAYIKATQQISLLSKAVERAKVLWENDVIGAAELQRREAELAAAKADLNAAHDQLLILGMPAASLAQLGAHGKMQSISNVVSRIAGTVIERKARLGQVVQPADELFIVADLSHVWAVAEVPERQIDLVQKGEDVLIEIPALDNRQVTGKLIFVSDVVNPETRTVMVRSDIDNSARQIKPDMLVSMLLKSKEEKVLAIPTSAVVKENDKNYVFVNVNKQQYRLREVMLGREYDHMVEVNDGLDEGENIIADGAFHVNNERKRKELE